MEKKGEYDLAIGYFEQALAIFRKALGEEHPNLASTCNNLGNAWDNKGEYDRTVAVLQKVLSIQRKALGDRHPAVTNTYNSLGEAWLGKAKLNKALKLSFKALNLWQDIDHLQAALALKTMGRVWTAKDNVAKAASYYRQALSIPETKRGKAHPTTQEVRRLLQKLKKR